MRLLYRNLGALRGSGGSINPSARQRRYHDRWVHYTTDPTVSGGSMNPSARQRRYHDRGIHYTMITGQWRFDILCSLAISCNHYIIIS